ncbi:ABC transporter permease subunit [Aeromicrobium wangtongii]|uniref:ABC transporter permease subunit n=1 Tax=Aeromicrobium wangtongii TaxID=2969247 RepID=A0ABY5MD45_9ACTN|nr:ABC transporter permease subunit [Aeromicrobium wangtongii]MCD9197155.1 ABC transporter permease subunit [Aeromicrobium wangtongii]UUP14652.1 ABC transporter permease subunit [Aeromicrobium wangtongii]
MRDVAAVAGAELFKLVRRPAAWTLLAAAAVLNQVFGYLIPYLAYSGGGSGPMEGAPRASVLASTLPDQLVASTLGGFPVFAGALALVLGALVLGSEHGWGTVKTILTQRPGRTAVITGQGVALAVSLGVAVLVLFALGAVSSTAIALAEDRSAALPPAADLLAGYGAGVAIMWMWAALGGVLAVVLRGVALPVGLGVVWVLGVENLVAGVAGSVLSSLAPLRDVLPGINAGSLAAAVMPGRPAGVDSPPGINTDVADGRALLTVATYIVICLAVTTWTFRRTDVS